MKKATPAWLLFLVALAVAPLALPGWMVYLLTTTAIYAVAAVGMTILMGLAGQISLGHAGFFAIGAYGAAILADKGGLPIWVVLPAVGLLSAVLGMLVGIPALRLSGFYLGIATLGFSVVVNLMITQWNDLTKGLSGYAIAKPAIGPIKFDSDTSLYYLALVVAALLFLLAHNIITSFAGRAFMAIRDAELPAQVVGVDLARTKTTAFAVSAFYTGIAGGLYAFVLGYVNVESFNVFLSISFITMIVVGGVGSLFGSVLGAAFITLLPEAFSQVVQLQMLFQGLALILVMVFLPEGIVGVGRRLRSRRRPLLEGRLANGKPTPAFIGSAANGRLSEAGEE